MAIKAKARHYSLDDSRRLLSGIEETNALREPDRRGLTLPMFSILDTAVSVDRLKDQLEELMRPTSDDEDRIAVIQQLLEAIAAGQIRQERKLDRLIALLTAAASSRSGSGLASDTMTRSATRHGGSAR